LIREPAKEEPKAAEARKAEPRLRIVKLEERIAPKIAVNHNETLVREPAKAPEVRKEGPKPKLQVVKLEQRITPGAFLNHNETLVRDRSACAR
jgi:hypothetical protein